MACETFLRRNQSLAERKVEIAKTVEQISKGIIEKRYKVKVGPQGAISFDVPDQDRNGVTDTCIYRRIMSTGSAMARMQIAKAEQLAGRSVDRSVIGQGVHSHDGGKTWHRGH